MNYKEIKPLSGKDANKFAKKMLEKENSQKKKSERILQFKHSDSLRGKEINMKIKNGDNHDTFKMKKKDKELLTCKYCNGIIKILETSNHIIGCNLEAIAQILRYRGIEMEARELDKIASRIK